MCQNLLLAALIILAAACQKDIGFNNIENSYEADLFVEGILYPDERPKIYLSSSLPFLNDRVSPVETFVRDAEVTITSLNSSEILQPDSIFDKFRCRWNPFYGGNKVIEYGQTYDLDINYQGKKYHASTTIDQPKVNIKEVVYTPQFFDVYGGHDGVIIRLDDPPGIRNNYRFQMDRWIDNTRMHAHVLEVIKSNCTQEEELFQVVDLGRTIFRDDLLDGMELEFYIEVSFEYLEGDSATIYIQNLDEKSAVFYHELDAQLQSILNPFVEPFFIKSQINGAIGVFGSAVRSDPVPFVYPQDNP